jgi:hypothetical protein
VLETEKRRKEKECKRLAVCSRSSAKSGTPCTGLSGGAPDSVRCARLDSGEKAALRKSSAAYDYNSSDCPVSQWSAAESAGDVWPAPTVGRGHRTVSGAPTGLELQRSSAPEKEGDPHGPSIMTVRWRTGLSGAPLDRRQGWPPTAPSCLGAIKGTPMRMEELQKAYQKHSKTSRLQLMHSILCDSDLSSVWVVNSVRCVLSSSCDLCAWLCCGFESCVCCSSLPYFRASFVIIIVRARGSNLWRFLANERKTKKESRGIQVDHWITWKGLSATLVHWDATTWK